MSYSLCSRNSQMGSLAHSMAQKSRSRYAVHRFIHRRCGPSPVSKSRTGIHTSLAQEPDNQSRGADDRAEKQEE